MQPARQGRAGTRLGTRLGTACLPGAQARTMGGIKAAPHSSAVDAQMEGKSDASPSYFSQQSCFRGTQLQGGTSAPDQSRP